MDVVAIISKIRDGRAVTAAETCEFGKALAGKSITDAQVGAFAMAVRLNGMSEAARVGLTEGMRDSGDVLSWDLDGPVLDKHSTGGVGDVTSLLIAPALAACGAFVPMISGRGLGHTGGTLDKLEAIPGYVTGIGPKRLEHVLKSTGCAMVGATERVAPSDKRLYAIRDVTGTVESIDLITASILSKKLAAGLEGLVLDVKTGSGAFMPKRKDAENLAKSLVSVANGAGCPTTALITDMSQPLAASAGNAVEVKAAMETLSGERVNERLLQVTVALGAAVLAGSPLSDGKKQAIKMISDAISSGQAFEIFARMVAALGGPSDFDKSWRNCLPEANILREVPARSSGYVSAIDTFALGRAVVALGGGRMRETDRIDPAVGLSAIVPVGAKVGSRTSLVMVHASDEARADQAAETVRAAYKISQTKPKAGKLIFKEFA